jgi:DNA-binding transcriptional regulator YhcF (GntR family)
MKKLLAVLFTSLAIMEVKSQIIVTTGRFGNLKPGTPLDSINMQLNQQIKLKTLQNAYEESYDTVYVTYKSAPVRLVIHQFTNYNDEKASTELMSVYSESVNVSTRSGIKAGDNKFDVIKRLDGMYLTVQPEKELGKNISSVVLHDYENSKLLKFYFRDNILYAIECSVEIEYGC